MKNFKRPIEFKKSEYEGVNVYIHKGLKLKHDASVYFKKKIWLLPPSFGVKGIK